MSPTDSPDVAQLSARLAADNDRVGHFVDGLSEQVDAILQATKQPNPPSNTAQSGNKPGRRGHSHQSEQVAQRAEPFQHARHQLADKLAVSRSLTRLIGICSAARNSPARSNQLPNQ